MARQGVAVNSRTAGLALVAPALAVVALFFVAPLAMSLVVALDRKSVV
jgi:ABC-type sugar transport system permease subunit